MNTIPAMPEPENRRILVIDDNHAIHEDFRKILGPVSAELADQLGAAEEALFGDAPEVTRAWSFQIDSAFQGEEGLEKVRAAVAAGQPYAVAFIDVRMPPGWDGIETIGRIWNEFPDLQVVICTAYSDYSWDEISKAVGNTDHVLVLKKPFDNVEVLQMAHALAKKWQLTQIANRQMAELDALVAQRTAELRRANEELAGEVAEHSAAEEMLRCSEERFSKAFHGSPIPMAIQRKEGGSYLDANRSFLELIGVSRESALNDIHPLWAEEKIALLLVHELESAQAVRNFSATIRTCAGEIRDVVVAAENLELGSAPYYLLILQDITDRMRLENELRQSQKMEAVGRLAAGVAHDFNNILTVILGNTSLQLRNPGLDEKLTSSLQQVVQAAQRATALTRQLLAYSRKQIIQRRPLLLGEVVGDTVAMLRRLIGEHIAIELTLPHELPPIFADPSNVEQVIMNLVLNARDAMPDGGRITLNATRVKIDAARRALHPDAQIGEFVCLEVTDTGEGMSAATMDRMFEPFFTTKDVGQGTGMGLATVYGVLKQHGGWVEVQSALGQGTSIATFFPLSVAGEAPAAVPVETVAPENSNPDGVTILVVEDEEMLREFVGDALSALGYRVLTAASGREALEIWSRHKDEIDLLLTDVVMPESVSGRQLASTLIVDKPDLKVIFTSGYSAELLGPEFEQEKEHGFLAKPYLPDRLASTVANHLQRQPALTP